MISRREFMAFVAGLPLLPGFESRNLLAGEASGWRRRQNMMALLQKKGRISFDISE